MLFNTKLPEGQLVLLGQAQNYSQLHLYGLGAVASSYLAWGLVFGVISAAETLLSLGALAAVAVLTSRERRYNREDKVFAIVKTGAGYKVGVLRGRGLKPEYVEAGKAEIKVNEGWGKPHLGIKLSVKGQSLNIPPQFRVDHRLWKELL